jgi:hypothetical protein
MRLRAAEMADVTLRPTRNVMDEQSFISELNQIVSRDRVLRDEKTLDD